jgi:hypothetical protein
MATPLGYCCNNQMPLWMMCATGGVCVADDADDVNWVTRPNAFWSAIVGQLDVPW